MLLAVRHTRPTFVSSAVSPRARSSALCVFAFPTHGDWLNNGALLEDTDMDPNVCQTCHASFPTDNTVLVGSLNHCDVVRQ